MTIKITVRTAMVVCALVIACAMGHAAERVGAGRSATDIVRQAVVERLGANVEVVVHSITVTGDAPVFREARLDPSAWLGKPVRFSLATGTGAMVPVTAILGVKGDRVVTRRAISRGEALTAENVETVRDEIVDVPFARLPLASELDGARAKRPLAAGSTVLHAFVLSKRTIEPGDKVTAVASSGAIEVTALFVAADGGRVGDVIRVTNPETKKYLRGRIVRKGVVEVSDGR